MFDISVKKAHKDTALSENGLLLQIKMQAITVCEDNQLRTY